MNRIVTADAELSTLEGVTLQVERTRDPAHGDFACNIAMALARPARMAPRDIARIIADHLPATLAVERVEIAADETVPHGGCAIETASVDVDARLDTQLMRIFEAIED